MVTPDNCVQASRPGEFVVQRRLRHIYGHAVMVVDHQHQGRTVRYEKDGSTTCSCGRSACDHRTAASLAPTEEEVGRYQAQYGYNIVSIPEPEPRPSVRALGFEANCSHAMAPLISQRPAATAYCPGYGSIPIE